MREHNYYLVTFFKTLFFSFLVFLTPIKGLLILTGVAVVIDTIFAIYCTIKISGINSFKSSKLFNLAVKSFFYLGTIILSFLIDVYIVENKSIFGINLFISKLMTVFWIYIEIKSIDETSIKLGNKPFYETLKNIIAGLKSLKQDINELKNE
jgi:hypothetical protein